LDGYHIFFDGALVCNPDINDTIYSQSIQSDNVLKAVDYARNNDIYLELYTRDKFYTDQTNWTDEIHRKFFGVSIYRDDLTKIGSLQPILKMETIARAAEEFIKAEKMKLALGTCLRFSTARSPAFPEIDFVNIIEPGVSKGSALLKLADYLGVDLEEVIAVGDGYNDIPLLQTAGFGVAMGNAFAEVKAVADDITLTVGQGGVASVIDRHILGRTG
jgi:Cof subfamily protein (haloacid dehalogenase superfamily)